MEIEVFNEYKENVEYINLLKEIASFTLKKEKVDKPIVNIILVDNKKIHEINKKYRKIDRETDVISFALEDEDSMINASSYRILGDIYVSIDKAKAQAKEYHHSFKRELCFLVVHGLYHLLGYDHETKEEEKIMFQKQEEVLNEFGIKKEEKEI